MVVGDFAKEADTIVIGSGPGGYVAAIRAAQTGQKVIIIEKDQIGGVCLNVGCIPSKAMISVGKEVAKTKAENPYGLKYGESSIDFKALQNWKDNEVVRKLTSGIKALLKKNKVEIIQGEAMFTSDKTIHVLKEDELGETFSFKHAIIATGSRPLQLPGIEFNDNIIDSTGLLNLTTLPKSLIIVGGGYIGMELAGAYANLGSKVTVIEAKSRILNEFDSDLVKPVIKSMKEKGIQIITEAKVESCMDSKLVTLTYSKDGETKTLSAEKVAVLIGRKPNTDQISLELAGVKVDQQGLIPVDEQGRTNKSNIYAIGDIVAGPALAHKASFEAKVAAEAIAGYKGVAVDYSVIPTVCYTYPEIATVGLTENEAKEKGIEVKKAKFMFQSNGRALSMDEKEGFVRLISDKKTGLLIGAQMVGPEVSELVNEMSLAIENLMTAEDLVLTIHNHPSLSETFMDAAEMLLDQGIHQ
ncbi:dihydrolipoyl dehydrogenase [Facklamia miroungae]|uniref:Dihydrolipoyl dehydrogenase n=1 Tax=Facklamia miroungae TaxID=120956 RepID=A0A1G7TAI5_9LACT|nr:dihydrolipoyl dehydrogenase [Facklamia miroungae]NKZ29714.1 dihydrolipoyl dehydrogenase [Facklamia miroungae]SDG31639.1 dihydrolipoamide dehydrogenase [Facklamia miroungae]